MRLFPFETEEIAQKKRPVSGTLQSCLSVIRELRQHVHDSTVAAFARVLDHTGDRGEQRVISADADIASGKNLRSALTDNDRPGKNRFAAVGLHTASLTIRVAAVL